MLGGRWYTVILERGGITIYACDLTPGSTLIINLNGGGKIAEHQLDAETPLREVGIF